MVVNFQGRLSFIFRGGVPFYKTQKLSKTQRDLGSRRNGPSETENSRGHRHQGYLAFTLRTRLQCGNGAKLYTSLVVLNQKWVEFQKNPQKMRRCMEKNVPDNKWGWLFFDCQS